MTTGGRKTVRSANGLVVNIGIASNVIQFFVNETNDGMAASSARY
jgi:hypothetical protein